MTEKQNISAAIAENNGPFDPKADKKWRVYYNELENGRLRYVLGFIDFPKYGGVLIRRFVDSRIVWIAQPVKIEEEFDDVRGEHVIPKGF